MCAWQDAVPRNAARRCTVAHAAGYARLSCSAGPAAACCIRCKSKAVRVVLAAGGGGLEVTGARCTQAHATVLKRRAVRLTEDTARSDSYAPALQECHVRVCTRTRPAAGQAPRAARHGSAGLRAHVRWCVRALEAGGAGRRTRGDDVHPVGASAARSTHALACQRGSRMPGRPLRCPGRAAADAVQCTRSVTVRLHSATIFAFSLGGRTSSRLLRAESAADRSNRSVKYKSTTGVRQEYDKSSPC